MSQASRELKGAKAGSIALVLFDVDGLKAINDSCGHRAGDELLLSAARYLQLAAGKKASVFRIGGDEFALILDRSKGDRVAPFVRALSSVEVVFDTCNHIHPVNVSCGYASSLDQESFESLFHRADMRMYESKQRARRDLPPPARPSHDPAAEVLTPSTQESLALP
jgi:diguanylate cyclase (GGDEF)-like protein